MSNKTNDSTTYGRLADELHNHTKNSNLKLESKSKLKKSLIPKRESNVEAFNPDAAANPEVKNAVKDIIKLLKGLDNISGGPQLSEADDDGGNQPPNQNDNRDKRHPQSSSSSKEPSYRPVRVSNITLKHEDPKFMRVTFETFEPEHVADAKEASTKKNPASDDTPVKDSDTKKSIKLGYNKSKLKGLQVTSSGKNVNDLVKIRPLKAVHDFHEKPLVNNMTEGKPLYANPEVIELINNYRDSMEHEEAGNNNDEDKFYSYKFKNVYKEPTLNIFLPYEEAQDKSRDSCRSHRSPSTHETSPPTNFGAPYFRLDGSILEDAHVGRGIQNNININKYVNSAVQEQHLMYKEATDAAKLMKKKVVRTESNQQNKPKRTSYRQIL